MRNFTLALVAIVGLVATSASTAAADPTEFGFVPGSAFARAHQTTQQFLVPGTVVPPQTTRSAVLAATEVLQAGAHADASTGFRIINRPGRNYPRPIRDVIIDSPPGFVGSTVAVPVCPVHLFQDGRFGKCPTESQVGISVAEIGTDTRINSTSPIFKLPPPPDAPARFGFRTSAGQTVFIVPKLRSDGDYGLRVNVLNLASMGLMESVSTLWGVPYASSHNVHRWQGPDSEGFGASVPVGAEHKPFLTNPTYCDSGPLPRTLSVRSWAFQDFWAEQTVYGSNSPQGCDRLEFGSLRAPASLSASPDSRRAGGPTGLEVQLHLPYNPDPNGLARPTLRTTEVVLPEGMTVNPSSANGLAACSEDEIGMKSLEAPRCPDASKLASVEVVSPLLDKPLHGAVYIAEQYRNPLGSLMALYLHVEGSGVRAKVVGRVDRDPVSGRVSSKFEDNPQLPFTHMKIRFNSGPRASLVVPPACGRHETTTTLMPWSHPHTGPAVVSKSRFTLDSSSGCVENPADRGFAPTLVAGTGDPTAGAFSAFSLAFARNDGEKELKTIKSVRLPSGLVGKVASVDLCDDARAAMGTCPAESRIGHVQVAAGAGDEPLWVPQAGKSPTGVFLTGPYRGAPYGVSIVVPAQGGPFDLGTVVARSALHVDRRTARISSGVDEVRLIDTDGRVAEQFGDDIPRILEGVVLNQREIRVMVDRKDFMINPTNCSQQGVSAEIHAYGGGQVESGSRFRAVDCAVLPFKPRLSLELVGKNQRTTGKHPGVKAVVRQTGVGEAGIKRAKVTLPKSLALDVNNAQALCEFEDGIKDDLENHCPRGSIVGKAQADTPLLKQPLKGNVYFVKNVRRDPKTGNAIRTLPMIIVALRGEVAINLRGESNTTKAGRLVNTFDQTPDAPITRFNLDINGGSNGILAVTRTRTAKINLCTKPNSHVADAQMGGQNGKPSNFAVRMKTPCAKKSNKAAKKKAAAKRKAAKKKAKGKKSAL